MFKRVLLLAGAVAIALVSVVINPGVASAASVQMRNNPTYAVATYCQGNVVMTYFITDRTDISSATYYDQYYAGGWVNASASYTLLDSDTHDYTMITNLTQRQVRVRANHYVTTTQGTGCTT
jgi:hypothetical protein